MIKRGDTIEEIEISESELSQEEDEKEEQNEIKVIDLTQKRNIKNNNRKTNTNIHRSKRYSRMSKSISKEYDQVVSSSLKFKKKQRISLSTIKVKIAPQKKVIESSIQSKSKNIKNKSNSVHLEKKKTKLAHFYETPKKSTEFVNENEHVKPKKQFRNSNSSDVVLSATRNSELRNMSKQRNDPVNVNKGSPSSKIAANFSSKKDSTGTPSFKQGSKLNVTTKSPDSTPSKTSKNKETDLSNKSDNIKLVLNSPDTKAKSPKKRTFSDLPTFSINSRSSKSNDANNKSNHSSFSDRLMEKKINENVTPSKFNITPLKKTNSKDKEKSLTKNTPKKTPNSKENKQILNKGMVLIKK